MSHPAPPPPPPGQLVTFAAYRSVVLEGAVLDCEITRIIENCATRAQAAATAADAAIPAFHAETFNVDVLKRQVAGARDSEWAAPLANRKQPRIAWDRARAVVP